MKKKINALQVTLKKIDALAKKFHTWKKLRKKNQAARKFPPLYSTKGQFI